MSETEWVAIPSVEGAVSRNAKAAGATIKRYGNGRHQVCVLLYDLSIPSISPLITVTLHMATEAEAERLAVIAVAMAKRALGELLAAEQQNNGGSQ